MKAIRRITDKSNNRIKAKNSSNSELSVYKEVVNLSLLKEHPYIVKFIDFFQEEDWHFIVMEHLAGGSLFDRIGNSKTAYSENDVRDITRELLKGIKYCHDNNIAHLDLKAKNVLLKVCLILNLLHIMCNVTINLLRNFRVMMIILVSKFVILGYQNA